MADTIHFEWRPAPSSSPEEIEQTNAQLRDHGADIEKDGDVGFFPIIPVIIGAMALVKLGHMVMDFVRDGEHGGLIIDARYKPVHIQEDRSLDRGKVIVINAKGEASTFVDASTKPEDLTELIKSAMAGATPAAAGATA